MRCEMDEINQCKLAMAIIVLLMICMFFVLQDASQDTPRTHEDAVTAPLDV